MTDPNWLLSTSAQSAAAIVAIIGGFLVSRVLALSAERNGIKSRLKEVRNSISFKAPQLDGLEKEILDERASSFIRSALDKIVETRGEVSLADLIEGDPATSLTEEQLQPYFDEAAAAIQRAYRFFLEEHRLPDDPPKDLGDFLKKGHIEPPSGDWRIYRKVYARLRKHQLDNRRSRSPLGLDMPILSERVAFDIDTLDVDGIGAMRFNKMVNERDTLRLEVKWLKTQENELLLQLNHLGKPQGLNLGMAALAYFSLSGIIVPIFWLPVVPEAFTYVDRCIIVALFVSGLVAVLGYLLWSIRQLSK